MSKKRKVYELFDNFSDPPDWTLCLLCQRNENNKDLRCPAKNVRKFRGAGYTSIANDLIGFYEVGELPKTVVVYKYCDQGAAEIEQVLTNNNACFHKKCRMMYEGYKLERTRKKKAVFNTVLPDKTQTQLLDTTSDLKTDQLLQARVTRSTSTPTCDIKTTCLFCNQGDGNEKLVQAMTIPINDRIWNAATKLQDGKILSKLAGGDMVSLEAKYHKPCLASYYNRLRKHNHEKKGINVIDISYSLAVEEVIAHIEDLFEYGVDISPVFHLNTLTKLVVDRMVDQGADQSDAITKVHKTRLKETLMHRLPILKLHQDEGGRCLFFTFEGDGGNAILKACESNVQNSGVIIKKTTEILRNDMFKQTSKFNGQFNEKSEQESVSEILISFLQIFLQGSNIDDKVSTVTRRSALSIAQLIQFNSVKYKRKIEIQGSHDLIERETPLPLYIGLEVYALTRKKKLINKLHKLGLSVSYWRVQEVTEAITQSLCKHYEDISLVSPPGAIPNVFTTSAIDNIDQNTSSYTSMNSFHGSGISLIQHPALATKVTYELDLNKKSTLLRLPETYTNVPYTSKKTPEIPLSTVCAETSLHSIYDPISEASGWLENVKSAIEANIDIPTWSAYNSRISYLCKKVVTPSFMLPLIDEYIATPSMIRHCMDIVKLSVENINPGQVVVVTGDQPVYALMKQVQWLLPKEYGEDKFVAMMGGLHIEMAMLNVVGNWLEGSGWIEIMISAGVTTGGRGDMILNGKQVKRSRYAHQVSLAAFHIFLKQEWESDEDNGENSPSFQEWIKRKCENSVQFLYWHTAMVLESLILMLVKSLRDANISMYTDALSMICPWMFALDHTHYSRWLPVFVKNLKELPIKHKQIWTEFERGNFTSRRTDRPFSSISEDQMHEQNNKIVKIDGGPIGLFDSPDALLKWMVSSPEVTRILMEFEFAAGIATTHEDIKHHEDSAAFAKRFKKDVNNVVKAIETDGNPFEGGPCLVSMVSKRVMNVAGESSVKSAIHTGQEQYNAYVQDRLVECKVSIYNTIPRNNLQLFRSKTCVKNKSRQKIQSIKEDCSLFQRLFIACQTREGDLDVFFSHENKRYPPSLSEYGDIRKGTKSDLLECLEVHGTTSTLMPSVTGVVVDGAAAVHKVVPKKCNTFLDYCEDVFKNYIISSYSRVVERVDLVFDLYWDNSLKASTRMKRGTGDRIKVTPSTPIPKNWSNFLKVEENKEELFQMLSRHLIQCIPSNRLTLVCTIGSNVLTNDNNIDLSTIDPCNHEEADSRLLLHAHNMRGNGHMDIVISTVDSDIVIIALSVYHEIDLRCLWIEFGTGNHKKYIPIHSYAQSLGVVKCSAMPFWHAFSGCDTVSSFSGRGKKSVMDTWIQFEEVTPVFSQLSKAPKEITDHQFALLEKFTVHLFDRRCQISNVNECRKYLFTKKNRRLENIPPSKAALLQHAKRAAYQGGHVWGQCLIQMAVLPEPSSWGWRNTSDGYRPLWTDLPEVSVQSRELVKCGCKVRCGPSCNCVKASLMCSHLCVCDGQCSRDDLI